MSKLDPRIIRVGIEVDGQLRMYEDLWIAVNVVKFANSLQNEAQLQIANLSKDARDHILTETSPYNRSRRRKRCVIEAGRVSTGAARIYTGDICEATVSQPPDITLSMKCRTGWAMQGNMGSLSMPPYSNLSSIAAAVAQSADLPLVFQAEDKQIANFSYAGAVGGQVGKLGESGGVNAYIDDDTLIVKSSNKALDGSDHALSERTGMIGIPELTDQGVRVKFLFDNRAKLGGRLAIDSKINPSLNGNYIIYKLSYSLATRAVPFYCVAECRREGGRYGLYF